MAQAKGILPRGDDRDVLYNNAKACGYFVGVKLDPAIDRPRVEALFDKLSELIDRLVARLPAATADVKGEKVAAVAVGLAPTFFTSNGQPRFNPPLEPPTAFDGKQGKILPFDTPTFAGVPKVDAELILYVVSTWEARLNAFVSDLAALTPDIQAVTLDRGFQRMDGTEPFGYKDGLRNVRSEDRPRVIFVHRDGLQAEEPIWADGGSYLAFMRILQRPDQMAALADDAARDAVIGRQKDGTRLDLVGQNIPPRAEPPEPVPNLPAGAHVAKAGPRGARDDNQIFRRGLPFMETTPDGKVEVGLNFCSFHPESRRLLRAALPPGRACGGRLSRSAGASAHDRPAGCQEARRRCERSEPSLRAARLCLPDPRRKSAADPERDLNDRCRRPGRLPR
jgi:Dyp-type peroxidase family